MVGVFRMIQGGLCAVKSTSGEAARSLVGGAGRELSRAAISERGRGCQERCIVFVESDYRLPFVLIYLLVDVD